MEWQTASGFPVILDEDDYFFIKAIGASINLLNSGYGQVYFKGRWIQAHRFLYEIHNISMGAFQVDHINGQKRDCRKKNLRLATNQSNQHNREVKGVSFIKKRNKWQLNIGINYKTKWLGYYQTKEAALKARQEFMKQLHEGYNQITLADCVDNLKKVKLKNKEFKNAAD